MRRYLLDTGIASDFVNRRLGVARRDRAQQRQGDPVGICTPVLAELAAGVLHSDDPDRRLTELRRNLTALRLWPFDEAAALEYGRVYARLRQLHRPMQQIDIQIAAVALSLGNCTVVSKDSDFTAVPGLTVENWAV